MILLYNQEGKKVVEIITRSYEETDRLRAIEDFTERMFRSYLETRNRPDYIYAL